MKEGGGYLDLLKRNRDFRRLYLAALVSLAGDWFLTVALLDLVLELTGSATLASLIVVCQTLPVFLTTPFAGHWIDRLDRRRLMIGVDIARIFAALLPILATSPSLLPLAFAAVVLISVGAAIFDPAAEAALPNLVEPEDLGRANVLFGSTWGTMLAAGAALGGFVTMQFGRNVSFVVDAFSFLVAALLLSGIKRPFSEARAAHREQPQFRQSLIETWRYARDHPRVLALLSSKGGYGIGAGVVAMLSLFGKEVFHAGSQGIGLLFAARGLGALLGPFVVRGFSRSDNEQYRFISWAVVLFGIGYIGLALSPTLLFGLIAVFLAHLGGGAQWLTSTYGLQREVPDQIRGRLFAADYGFVTLTMSVSSLLTGVAADRFGAHSATIATASLCLAWGAAWGFATRRLWVE